MPRRRPVAERAAEGAPTAVVDLAGLVSGAPPSFREACPLQRAILSDARWAGTRIADRTAVRRARGKPPTERRSGPVPGGLGPGSMDR